MPEIAPFALSWIGVLSPGATPPQVLPPSSELIRTICWVGACEPSKLQQTYIVPLLPSLGLLGGPREGVLLSIASQFLSSRRSCSVIGLLRLSWTVIGGPNCDWPGFLMWIVMLKPVKPAVPPGASSTWA